VLEQVVTAAGNKVYLLLVLERLGGAGLRYDRFASIQLPSPSNPPVPSITRVVGAVDGHRMVPKEGYGVAGKKPGESRCAPRPTAAAPTAAAQAAPAAAGSCLPRGREGAHGSQWSTRLESGGDFCATGASAICAVLPW
jgi:hypothetical protein